MSINGGLLARSKAKEATIQAVVIRADGTREDLGTIAYWHQNPIMRWWGNLLRTIKEGIRLW
jgi:hypothetical protein